MLAFSWYFLKVLVCSGVIFGYYTVALKNKRFHHYNRVYLLTGLVISWLIPLLKIDFWNGAESKKNTPVVKLLTVIANGDAYVVNSQVAVSPAAYWDGSQLLSALFIGVSACFFISIIGSLVKLWYVSRSGRRENLGRVHLIFTDVDEVPFSFFNYIFLHPDTDLLSAEAKCILQHEMAHVREKHSLDKLLINVVLIVGWANPFFWLMRREMNMIHEFIADKKAIENNQIGLFASVLLKIALRQNYSPITNSFFHSPIKRRLIMLTKFKNSRYSYLRRLMILPLMTSLCLLFAFKFKEKVIIKSTGDQQQQVQNDLMENTDPQEKSEMNQTSDFLAASNAKNEGVQDAEGILREPLEKAPGQGNGEDDKSLQPGEAMIDFYEDQDTVNYQKVFTKVDKPASFPGGDIGYSHYLKRNLKYPEKAKTNNIEGVVEIQFIVNKEGYISNVKPLTNLGYGMEDEALKFIKQGPRWVPAKQNGKFVNYQVVQKISFSLKDSSE